MFILTFLSALLPQLTGLALVFALWPNPRPLRSDLLIKLCLATGIGFGISSCVYFVQLPIFGPARSVYLCAQAVLLVSLIAISVYRARAAGDATRSEPASGAASGESLLRFFSIVFFVALASTIITFIFVSMKRPHGDWDAWAVYNMKARFLAGVHWREIFTEPLYWAAGDYPLLIPAAIASCWVVIGGEAVAVPSLVAMFFTLGTIGLLACSVAGMRGRNQGLLAGLILVCTPYFIMHGADQYSDIPIGFFFLATIVLLHFYDRHNDGQTRAARGYLILAGVTAGLAGWTKNEGLLFIIAVCVSRLIVEARQKQLRPYLRHMLFFAAGVLPVLLVVIYLKLAFAPPNGLLSPREGPSLAAKLFDFSRYRLITDYFIRYILGFGNWAVGIVPVLFFYLLLLGAEVEEKEKRTIAASFAVLGIILAGYFMIYVISPRDVAWHMSTSLDRLLSQLWPSFLFLFFLIVRTPEQAFVKKEVIPA